MTSLYGTTLAPSPARATLLGATSGLPPVSLPEVLAHAELQTRLDRKYLVPIEVFPAVLGRLARRLRVLEINGRRAFGYESVYFDTPDLLCYRHHVQGQRRRFKARTRTYLDAGDCVLEVKVIGGRSETVKHRTAYGSVGRYHLSPDARRFIAERVYWPRAVDTLGPVLVTSYHRLTLVDLANEVRLTCDVDLTCRNSGRAMAGLGQYVLIEAKASRLSTTISRVFHDAGVRAAPLSKYCLAAATLYDGISTNPFHRTLRRYFSQTDGPTGP